MSNNNLKSKPLRPTPKLLNINDNTSELSLHAAVDEAIKKEKNKKSNSEKQNKYKKKGLLNSLNSKASAMSSGDSGNLLRRRTPMTMPRTKITAATPLEQQIALSKLKQKLSFNANDAKNKEPKNVNNNIGTDTVSVSSVATSEVALSDVSELNANKINERLNQVRDYLTQATSMYVSLSVASTNEPQREAQMSKLAKLIQQLRIQEKGYLDLLQKNELASTDVVCNDTCEGASTVSIEPHHDGELLDVASQEQELKRLREQQVLLKKIVEQQKELEELKERQAALLQMQENAEQVIEASRKQNDLLNNQQSQQQQNKKQNVKQQVAASELMASVNKPNVAEWENVALLHADAEQKRLEWESKLMTLQEKKTQMDQLLKMFKALKYSQNSDVNLNALNERSENESVNNENSDAEGIGIKINRLNEVRQRMDELKDVITSYESMHDSLAAAKTDLCRDNRLHGKAMEEKQADTITGSGGARLRLVDNQSEHTLHNLEKSISELDNRKRPVLKGQHKNDIALTRNAPVKNTNQENIKVNNLKGYLQHYRELQKVHSANANQFVETATTNTENEEESDAELSEIGSDLAWQEDPECQNKLNKLQRAKEKLQQLQNVVKLVQQGGNSHIPVDDLKQLWLSEDGVESSAYGESEEEGDEEESEDYTDGEQTEEEEETKTPSETERNTKIQLENEKIADEHWYQGLLRKQRLELNYLLKERERLLEAQSKLITTSGQPASVAIQTENVGEEKKKVMYPMLTKEKLNNQNQIKQKVKKSNDGMSVEPQYGSDSNYCGKKSSSVNYSNEKECVTVPLSNPMAVSEIRRQRELFEQRKKQKFVEKQRRKKSHQAEGNQSDDRATYSVHSDIDEGVGVSMYSADVTTAATWGGSTEQSCEEEDSAVGEDYAAAEERLANEDDEYASHFDQGDREEEEDEEVEEQNDSILPAMYKMKKFEEPQRRSISWHQNEVTPSKKRKFEKKIDEGRGSVSWSLDVSPPPSGSKPKQRNLTPAHKLIHDCKTRREKASVTVDNSQQPSDQLQTQLARMCNSLLHNEQTLLAMLQNQHKAQLVNNGPPNQPEINASVLSVVERLLESSNFHDGFNETLNSLRACYERVEQHQTDMEYLRQQLTGVMSTQKNNTDYRSPWPNPPSLHMSSFVENSAPPATTIPSCLKPTSSYPKETQTESSLFDDPFKLSIQPYTLFGETSLEEGLTPKVDTGYASKASDAFSFQPTVTTEAISPGIVGNHSFTYKNEEQMSYPYRLRMSEYNPLSYQGNFANTATGNVTTISRMSMNKDRAETNVSDHTEKTIWPSFFKMEEPALSDHGSDKSENCVLQSNTTRANDVENASNPRFESMRDSIYSEVATLIAMNESRPQYLIELFRELQLLNSDYLRQSGLFSLQELVTKFLTVENVHSSPTKVAFTQEIQSGHGTTFPRWPGSLSEHTPSESAVTTDDEEHGVLQSLAQQMQNNEVYDYAEIVDSQSEGNLSARSSLQETPFASEDLGNTVINLDEALQKMKMYEEDMLEAKKAFQQISQDVREKPSLMDTSQQLHLATVHAMKQRISDVANNKSNNSEISSDVLYPPVDMQLLDQQIKSLMMELVLFLNEHMHSMCTEELLASIHELIIHLVKNREPKADSEQFGRFFHTQLDAILKDCLVKYTSRKLRDCAEGMVVDVSEILFNEMAYFSLMQDLERPMFDVDASHTSIQQKLPACSKMPFVQQQQQQQSTPEKTDDNATSSVIETPELSPPKVLPATASNASSASSSNNYVMVDSCELSDAETESSRNYVKVELSASETRPVRSSGSGEEDNDSDPPVFMKVSAPASLINVYSQVQQDDSSYSHFHQEEGNQRNETEEIVIGDEDDREEVDQQEDERIEQLQNENAEDERDLETDELEDEGAEGQANLSGQNNEEEAEEDDLPEADMVAEGNASIAQAVLAHLDGQQELAGDGSALSPPEGIASNG